eukprot:1160786-Pyramimonas_sp.AAC.1
MAMAPLGIWQAPPAGRPARLRAGGAQAALLPCHHQHPHLPGILARADHGRGRPTHPPSPRQRGGEEEEEE